MFFLSQLRIVRCLSKTGDALTVTTGLFFVFTIVKMKGPNKTFNFKKGKKEQKEQKNIHCTKNIEKAYFN